MVKLIAIPKHLEEKIKTIPQKPGVYQMKDNKGNIIYIGKSKTLKTRVKSYFVTDHKWEKVKRMVFHIHDIDIIVTDTHLEAQLLECELIKKIQPTYNVQFKNDQKYKYLKVEDSYKNKLITIVDQREEDNCFGPYKSRHILLDLIRFFENLYPLCKREDGYSFTYHIFPPVISEDTFEENKNCLIEIFSEEKYMQLFVKEVEEKMKISAESFRFETACIYRDLMKHMQYLYYSHIKQTSSLIRQKILMGEKLEEGYKVFYISQGCVIHKKKYRRLGQKSIEKFLDQGQLLETVLNETTNEKRNLDFETILYAELKDHTSKEILIVNQKYDLKKFIEQLSH